MTSLYQELVKGGPSGATALTLGVFDGVHRGHRHLIHHLQAVAAREGVTPVVVTFGNHPITVLRPEIPLALLTTLEERLELLRAAGVEYVVPITFTRDLSLFTAEEFVLALREALGMVAMVVGPDFAMGHQRQGTIPVLQALGAKHGFSVEVVTPLTLEEGVVSSTAVRDALATGDVREAARRLDRPYAVAGVVERGEGRGAQLGFPTANVAVQGDLALPADGVYAAWLTVGKACYPAAVSIGTKPTFHEANPREVEAHALDFSGDLYGRRVVVEFAHRVRGQERFPTVDALVERMHEDVAVVREVLAQTPQRASLDD